jgi:hypothetical protein
MPAPNYAVLPHLAVQLALVAEKSGCQITSIKVWLRTVTELVDSVAFVNDNGLVPEILARAGVNQSDYFNVITKLSEDTEGDYYVYEMKLSHQE